MREPSNIVLINVPSAVRICFVAVTFTVVVVVVVVVVVNLYLIVHVNGGKESFSNTIIIISTVCQHIIYKCYRE